MLHMTLCTPRVFSNAPSPPYLPWLHPRPRTSGPMSSDVRPGRLCSAGTSAVIPSGCKALHVRYVQRTRRQHAPLACPHAHRPSHMGTLCTLTLKSFPQPPRPLTADVERGEARHSLQHRCECPCPLGSGEVVCKALSNATSCSPHAHMHVLHMALCAPISSLAAPSPTYSRCRVM